MHETQVETPRIKARRSALLQAGHDPDSPPLHAIEAHPLTKLAFLLSQKGRAGLDGSMTVENGLMQVERMTLHTSNGAMGLYCPGTMRIEIDQTFPEEMTISMTGLPLHRIVRMPVCGDAAVDAAIGDLEIEQAAMVKGRPGRPKLQIILCRREVMEMDSTPKGEDGRWKSLQPIPRI